MPGSGTYEDDQRTKREPDALLEFGGLSEVTETQACGHLIGGRCHKAGMTLE
jgi:hypothetical protein